MHGYTQKVDGMGDLAGRTRRGEKQRSARFPAWKIPAARERWYGSCTSQGEQTGRRWGARDMDANNVLFVEGLTVSRSSCAGV